MVDLYQAVTVYNNANPGFGAGLAVPTEQAQANQVAKALIYADKSQHSPVFKIGGGYLHQVQAQLAALSPEAATLMHDRLLVRPELEPFIKRLEFALAAIAQRSPETWEHLKNHTALTMMAFEPLHGGIATHPDHALQALVTALGHDFGKLAIDPELLHKNTRLSPGRFDYAIQNYEKRVPDYPQKAHDLQFLREANAGNLVFAAEDIRAAEPNFTDTIPFDAKWRNEAHWLSGGELAKHNRILARIDRLAQKMIPEAVAGEWLKPAEIRQLASIERGTLTAQERAVLATHDPMSSAFFALQQLPSPLDTVSRMVNMHQTPVNKDEAELTAIVKLTDTFEALTADRSYRKAYTASEALKTMEQDQVKSGEMDAALFSQFVSSQVWKQYAQAKGVELGDETGIAHLMQPVKEAPASLQPASAAQDMKGLPAANWTQRVEQQSRHAASLSL